MARNARSLDVLTAEVKARSPRTTVYDIGDPDHQGRDSDHNPNRAGVVCAIDIMPGHGLDLGELAEEIRARRHPAGKYVIYQDRIASAARGWTWRDYTGDYHTHVHVSVGIGPDGTSTGPYDNTEAWLGDDMALTDDDLNRIALKVWTWDLLNGPGVREAYKVLNEAGADADIAANKPPVQPSPVEVPPLVAALVAGLRPALSAIVREEIDKTRLGA